MPDLRDEDTWIMDLWNATCSDLIAGERIAYVSLRCAEEGLEAAAGEALYRVLMVHSITVNYHARMRSANG